MRASPTAAAVASLALLAAGARPLAAREASPPAGARQILAAAEADYERRALGAAGDRAQTGPIEAAIAEYRRALAEDPSSAGVRWRLLRALFFRWSFCGADRDERLRRVTQARRIADEGLALLERQTSNARGSERVARLRGIEGAAGLEFWAAVTWGEWALARGKLAAARQGAGTKIRDLAQTVIELDPRLEEGGGYRVLGRLHDQSPRIPFLSGWVSRQAALANLRKALAIAPDNTVNELFLAEAILDHDPADRQQARDLLARCAAQKPREEYLVEDRHFSRLAAERLSALGGETRSRPTAGSTSRAPRALEGSVAEARPTRELGSGMKEANGDGHSADLDTADEVEARGASSAASAP